MPWIALESINDQPRERKVLYISFEHRTLNIKRESEFDDGRFASVATVVTDAIINRVADAIFGKQA